MSEIPADSPYPLGTLVRDPRLLQNRNAEIAQALDALAPLEGDRQHAVVIGEPHSGRSSVLAEVSRRAEGERNRLVVALTKPEGLPPDRPAFIRHLLIAIVEAIAAATDSEAPWYAAWRQRVYLRDTGPVAHQDLLSAALFLAGDPCCEIDRAVLERDLVALAGVAREGGFDGIVITIDDASPLTEDIGLVEALVDSFDLIGNYVLLIAGLPSTATHFTQAASPCLQRFRPVWLIPFFGPRRIVSALRAPLVGADNELLRAEDADHLRDITQLTAGNPYELMVVAHHLWMSCKLGEQDHFVLTPRVLDRIIPHISMLTANGDALRDGAEAIDLLPEERIGEAVELASLSRLSVREIAVTRLLGAEKPGARPEKPIEVAEVDAEADRVRSALEDLEGAGVVQLHTDGQRFNVVGGRAASVLLKYKARARIGAAAVGRPFDLGFLWSVGRELAREAALRWLEEIDGGNSLGFHVTNAPGGIGRHSPRPAIRALAGGTGVERLIEADLDFAPWNGDAYDRIAKSLTRDEPTIALVCTSVMYGGDQLEYLEAWELPEEVGQSELDQALSLTTETWVPLVESAELIWSGSEGVALRGQAAREALIALFHFGATSAVHELFGEWLEGGASDLLFRARRVADESVSTLRMTGQSDLELGGELGGMLSRLGFLQSFEDDLLDQAQASLEEALRLGPGDGWVTRWNLANVLARQDEPEPALAQLDLLAQELDHESDVGYVFFFLPGRATIDSFVKVSKEGIRPLLELQRSVINGNKDAALTDAIEECVSSGDEAVAGAAGWVDSSPMPAL
jgi:hypothetical protein